MMSINRSAGHFAANDDERLGGFFIIRAHDSAPRPSESSRDALI